MTKKNGIENPKKDKPLPDGNERKALSKELFRKYKDINKQIENQKSLLKIIEHEKSNIVKEIYERLGQKHYMVDGKKLTPTKRVDKETGIVRYFFRGDKNYDMEIVE